MHRGQSSHEHRFRDEALDDFHLYFRAARDKNRGMAEQQQASRVPPRISWSENRRSNQNQGSASARHTRKEISTSRAGNLDSIESCYSIEEYGALRLGGRQNKAL